MNSFRILSKLDALLDRLDLLYLEGSHAELNIEAQVNAEVVRQKIEEHVVSTKQGDEEEGGFGQASVAHSKETRYRS